MGVDLSADFVELARAAAAAEGLGPGSPRSRVADVRDLAFDGEFDAAICLCQGGFGLLGGATSPPSSRGSWPPSGRGGRLALSAFSAYFALRFLEDGETFDPATGVLHEVSHRAQRRRGGACLRSLDDVLHGAGARAARRAAPASTSTASTACRRGSTSVAPPDLDRPELLLVGRRHG